MKKTLNRIASKFLIITYIEIYTIYKFTSLQIYKIYKFTNLQIYNFLELNVFSRTFLVILQILIIEINPNSNRNELPIFYSNPNQTEHSI